MRPVEDLVAGGAARRKPLLGQRNPQSSDLIARHIDGGAVFGQAMRDLGHLKVLDDARCLCHVQIAIEQGVARIVGAEHQPAERADHQRGDDPDKRRAYRPESAKQDDELLHVRPCVSPTPRQVSGRGVGATLGPAD